MSFLRFGLTQSSFSFVVNYQSSISYIFFSEFNFEFCYFFYCSCVRTTRKTHQLDLQWSAEIMYSQLVPYCWANWNVNTSIVERVNWRKERLQVIKLIGVCLFLGLFKNRYKLALLVQYCFDHTVVCSNTLAHSWSSMMTPHIFQRYFNRFHYFTIKCDDAVASPCSLLCVALLTEHRWTIETHPDK